VGRVNRKPRIRFLSSNLSLSFRAFLPFFSFLIFRGFAWASFFPLAAGIFFSRKSTVLSSLSFSSKNRIFSRKNPPPSLPIAGSSRRQRHWLCFSHDRRVPSPLPHIESPSPPLFCVCVFPFFREFAFLSCSYGVNGFFGEMNRSFVLLFFFSYQPDSRKRKALCLSRAAIRLPLPFFPPPLFSRTARYCLPLFSSNAIGGVFFYDEGALFESVACLQQGAFFPPFSE